jgi:hypothetical protein
MTSLEVYFGLRFDPTLLFNYLTTVAARAPELETLSFLNVCVRHAHSREQLAIHVNDPELLRAFGLLQRFGSLRLLGMDGSFLTLNILDIIGDLPLLHDLIVYGLCRRRAPYTLPPAQSVEKRKGKFRALKSLLLYWAKVDTVESFLQIYLHEPNHSLLDVRFSTPDRIGEARNFEWLSLANGVQELEHLHVEFARTDGELADHNLTGLKACRKLRSLNIDHTTYLTINQASFQKIISSWANLTELCLSNGGTFGQLGLSPEELAVHADLGRIDISCLGTLASQLHRLKNLEICVLACDTSRLNSKSKGRLEPFQNLCYLEFGRMSLVNWSLPGFNHNEAAGYISALVSPKTEFIVLALEEKSLDDLPATDGYQEWIPFAKDYSRFLRIFEKQVNECIKTRSDEMLLTARCGARADS